LGFFLLLQDGEHEVSFLLHLEAEHEVLFLLLQDAEHKDFMLGRRTKDEGEKEEKLQS
jgi:hypothetical protein